MFVFFLGMNKKKRANQPSQPARLVTETASGSPLRDWNLFGLHLEAHTPLRPDQQPQWHCRMYWLNQYLIIYNVYRERERQLGELTYEILVVLNHDARIYCEETKIIAWYFIHIWVNEYCFWLFLFAEMQFQEIRRAFWGVSHHSKFTEIYPLGECCLNVSFSEIQFNYKSQLPVVKLEATSRYNFYWVFWEFLGLPVFHDRSTNPPPENVPPQK